MFDNIGKDLDEEANKRRAQSFLIAIILGGATTAFVVGFTAYTAAELILEPFNDEEMVEVLLEDEAEDLEAPPPPPPPPPPAAAAEEEDDEEEDEPDPEDEPEEVQELKEEVKKEIKNDNKPKGVEGGQEGGVEGGVVGGVQGGIVGGVIGGKLGGGGVRVFHHSELEVKKRSQPKYPEAAKSLSLGDQKCIAKVFIDESGVPYDVIIEKCPKVFHPEAKQAILKWRWYPPKDGKSKVKAQTTIGITYKMK